MLKRDITFENPFNETEKKTETHYFHISKADLVRLQVEEHGHEYTDKDGNKLDGMQAKIQRIVEAEDGKAIMQELEDIIRLAYGVRGEGDRFIKNDQVWQDFKSSAAYSQLFFELCTKADAMAEFINNVVPSNLDKIAEEIQKEAEKITQQQAFVEAAAAKGVPATSEGATPTTGTAQPADPLPPEPEGSDNYRQHVIESATPENPVHLTQEEVAAMDSDDLKSGVATGRYRIS